MHLTVYKLTAILGKPGWRCRYSDWLRVGDRDRVRVPVGARMLSSACRPDRLLSATSYTIGIGGYFPWVKRPGREADVKATYLLHCTYTSCICNVHRKLILNTR
jgi:hypothetical protein